MRFLILLLASSGAYANTIAEDAAGEISMHADGPALLVSAFCVLCACIAIKERKWGECAAMLAVAGAAWINTTVTALIVVALVFIIPIGIIVDKVRR